MTIEERLVRIEVELELLKHERPVAPSTRLLVAAEKTADVLRAWRESKGELIHQPDFDDYARVVSTLPLLEEALAAVKQNGSELKA